MVKKYLKGGKSEGMSLSEVAKVHNMNAEQLRPQLQKGIKHELEHTDKITDARRIALDHLVEFPDYYDRLDKIEKMHLGGDMSKHLAPNGKHSNLTHEQWHLVRTPEFKNWFGDWENDQKNASKVVDENGEPLVVYHGTKYIQEFYDFDLDAIEDEKVKAFFFSRGYEHAKRYTWNRGSVKAFFLKAIKLFDPKSLSTSESKKIRSILNESVVEDFIEYNYLDGLEEWKSKYDSNMSDEDLLFYILTQTDSSWQVVELEVVQDYLKSNDYDGFITYEQVTNQSTPNINYAVFEPNQIKLADGTNTTFDGNNLDIRFEEGGYVNSQIEKIAKSVVFDLGEQYSENDYLGKCKEISEEIAKRLNQIDIKAIPMRIIDGEDKKYNSPVFNHAYTFIPITNQIIDTQLWQVDGNPTDLKSRKVLFDYDDYNNLVELYEVEPIFDWENKFAKGGRTISQTPAPKSDRVVGSKTNPKGSASDSKLGKSIKFNDSLEKAIQNKVDVYNEKHPRDKVSLSTAKAIVRRGMGAYSTSHRPTISGGAPNSRQAWGLARLNKFLLKKAGVKVKSAYIQDDDLLKYANGGEVVAKNMDIRSNFNTMDKEVKHTMGKAGGYLVGRRHTEGGIKAMNKATGQPLEMEGGEVVITRNAVSDSKTREFEGQMLTNREILSKINESGGGVSFEDGGEVMVCGNQYNYGGTLMSDHDILHQMAVGGELDDMNEMEFEYGGDVSDFKLKNKIVFPINDVDNAYYVNIFDDPMDLQIFKVEVSVRGSGRPIFKGFTKWSKDEFVSKRSYQFYNRKDFLTLIEPQAKTTGVLTPRPFTQIPKKSMLIPRMPNTMAMYDRFTSILDVGMQNVPSQYNTDAKTKFNWLLGNPTFQENIMEFFDEWAIQEPNFVYEEGVKKKVVRAKKEDKFQYGIESIKFGKSWESELKPYNNKLVKNDGQNLLVNLLTKVIKEFYQKDITKPNLKLYEDRTMEIPVKELSLIQKNGGVKMDYGLTGYGLRNIEMRTTDPTRNKLLNKKSGYNLKLIIDNIENLGGANIYYYLFDKMGYQYGSAESTWKQWFKNDNIDFNIKLSLDDYCRVVGYLLARYCEENDFPLISPIYNIDQ